MTVYHVRFTCALDYLARRLPYRPAHLKQLARLREHGQVVAGGPEPDGTAAHIFYRVADHPELTALLDDNEFNRAGLFVASHPRAFTEFVEPLELPPIDAGLGATIVEAATADPTPARGALAALQRRKRAAFGGFFGDGAGLVVMRSTSADEATAWLADAGGWPRASLTARAWCQTL